MGNTTWFAQNGFRVLWIAHWTTATSPTRARPATGAGRVDVLAVHQLSGMCRGISGHVDLDRFRYANLAPYRIP